MAELVAPPDVEAWLVTALRTAYAARGETATVATKVPADRPARMTRVSLVDTVPIEVAHFAVPVLVECWAATTAAASELARTTYALVRAMEGTDTAGMWVAAVGTVGGVAYLPDLDAGPRYQFTVQFTVGGELI
ncbi:hypothetical protein IU501_10915 [Nocardia otitidiscaviarum]|uniref:hypothetical protein n=1 Tax=Nocardia otitidiscaviarum TaxID=1823 RepID=UPI001896144C|nr:hypothetical protein [Nocardia otitidiscaviarum]MBF6133510.1 hypothetical protein [Nocardia otitidiscaviarum]